MSKVIDLAGLSRFWANVDKRKASKDGIYPDLTAGDLAGRGESVLAEFGFRASGGKSIKDGRAYIKRIKGNSVVCNQKIKGFASWNLQGGTIEGNEAVWSAESRTGALNAYSNTFAQHTTHKYLITADVKASSSNVGLGMYYTGSPLVHHSGSGQYERLAVITQGRGDGTDACYLTDTSTSGFGEIRAKNYKCTDLTQMFGAGNEPTTIEEYEARKPIVADEYAYNEGEVIHCNTESIKSVGDNAWDEQWENGYFNTDNGNNGAASGYIRSKNRIPVVSGEYYVSKPSNVGDFQVVGYDHDGNIIPGIINGASTFVIAPNIGSIRFYCNYGSDTYNGGILISLKHSGWKAEKDDQYQPYWQDTLPLPIINKYFPQGMKSAGTAHDEIRFNKASGKWAKVQRIIGVRVADYVNRDANGVFILKNLPSKPINDISGAYSKNVLMAGFTPDLGAYSYDLLPESRIAVVSDTIWLNGQQLEQYSTAQEYIDALGDTQLYYELAEPIVTEITEDFRDYYNVADFGTEQSQSAVPSAAFSADIIYQFNAVDMIREHELEINELQAAISTMQAQLAILTNNNA